MQTTDRLERRFTVRAALKRTTPEDLAKVQPVQDNVPQIKHVVVLMMENHSFDNYFGMLGPERGGFPMVDGQPTAPNPNRDKHGQPVPLHHREKTVQEQGIPTQSWRGSHVQFGDGACNGFVQTSEELRPDGDTSVGMAYFTEKELPFYYDLARTFPLATRWFCSCLGPTFPNRRFMMAGTANGLIDDLPFGMLDYPEGGTIFDVLTTNKITWANYHNIHKRRVLLKRVLGKPGLRAARGLGLLTSLLPPVRRFVIGNLQFTADLYPLGLLGVWNHLFSLHDFFRDAAAGTLPFFSIVDADFHTFSEENPQDIQLGEAFAAKVIDAVMQGPGWEHTVLLWTYDEHGGYYDHVPPPPATPPDDRVGRSLLDAGGVVRWILGAVGQRKRLEQADKADPHFDRLGIRVPAVVVSPYAKPGLVSETVFDHTSVLKLIEHKWGLPPLTRRDAEANDPLDLLDFDSPPAFLAPPTLAAPAKPFDLAIFER
jgi:phospholipase C